jgi:subtilisin family serine protease
MRVGYTCLCRSDSIITVSPLDLVGLSRLMALSEGRAETVVGVIDGPVELNHPDLAGASIRVLPGKYSAACNLASSAACAHGTFVAGILATRRGSSVPGICPGCTFLLRPIFSEANGAEIPGASSEVLASAIVESVEGGARVINLSSGLVHSSNKTRMQQALDYAAHRGVIVVAAAGNAGTLGSSAITGHPWVIPVAASDSAGRPLRESNLGSSIGRRGLSAPGENIVSLGTNTKLQTMSGTSAAAPFVTGAIALLCSEFPAAHASEIKWAITGAGAARRRSIAPPLLDGWAAYQQIASARSARKAS